MEAKLQHSNGGMGQRLHVRLISRDGNHKLLSGNKSLPDRHMGFKMKAILVFQLAFFLFAGTLIIHHEVQCARVQAVSEVIMALPIQALGEIKV